MYNILIWCMCMSQALNFFFAGPFGFFSCFFPFLSLCILALLPAYQEYQVTFKLMTSQVVQWA